MQQAVVVFLHLVLVDLPDLSPLFLDIPLQIGDVQELGSLRIGLDLLGGHLVGWHCFFFSLWLWGTHVLRHIRLMNSFG